MKYLLETNKKSKNRSLYLSIWGQVEGRSFPLFCLKESPGFPNISEQSDVWMNPDSDLSYPDSTMTQEEGAKWQSPMPTDITRRNMRLTLYIL